MPAITFILKPHFSLMAFTAAADVLVTANLVSGNHDYRIQTVATTSGSVDSDLGIRIEADARLSESALTAAQLTDKDVLVICGGYRCDRQPAQALLPCLKAVDRQQVLLIGLWNGALDLAAAGLMAHHECALHPSDHAYAREQYPDLRLSERTLVLDRQRWTAAGPSSSLDLMLALIRRQQGSDTVERVRAILKADVHDDEASEQALQRDRERQLPPTLRSAIELMRNNLDEPLARDELSHHVGVSTRALERLFRRHLDTSPARHYLELRLARARELLLGDTISIAGIAMACGFISSAHFSRAFSDRYGQSPRACRQESRRP